MADTKRKPDVTRLDGVNQIKDTTVNDCIDFTIQNVGAEKIYFGFSKDGEPDIPLNPNELSTWPLYRPCETWDGDIFIKFGAAGSIALILKTI
ncbi:MAG: hypothetical protein AAB638_00740 [Patescibacteria group bacterium]